MIKPSVQRTVSITGIFSVADKQTALAILDRVEEVVPVWSIDVQRLRLVGISLGKIIKVAKTFVMCSCGFVHSAGASEKTTVCVYEV
jgi:hypothetical protein